MQPAKDQNHRVLFICLGNICRSPLAEGAFRSACEKAGLDVFVDSAGTAAYHISNQPDPRAIHVARANGVDISQARGRQLSDEDFERFTHIFAMDTANLAGINARAPRKPRAKISLLLDIFGDRQGESIPDPYYGDESDFEECWQTVSEAVDELVRQLSSQSGNT